MKMFVLAALAVFVVSCAGERDTSWQVPLAINACEGRGAKVESIETYPVGDVLENTIMVHCTNFHFMFIQAPGTDRPF